MKRRYVFAIILAVILCIACIVILMTCNDQNSSTNDDTSGNSASIDTEASAGSTSDTSAESFSDDTEPVEESSDTTIQDTDSNTDSSDTSPEDTEPDVDPSESTSEDTEPDVEPSESTTEDTEPDVEPSESASEDTEPDVDPSESASEDTEPDVDPSESASEDTEPDVDPSESTSEDTEPDVDPSESTSEDTEPDVDPSESASEDTEPDVDPSESTTEDTEPDVDPSESTSEDTEPDETESETESEIIGTNTVSLEEWKKAFDFSLLDSFNISYDSKNNSYTTVGNNTTVTELFVSGIIKYQRGNILTMLTLTEQDLEYPEVTAYGNLNLAALIDVDYFIYNNYGPYYGFGMGHVIEYLMTSKEDCGYSDFTYSAEKDCYINTTNFEGEVVITEVYFENGALVRLFSHSEESRVDMTLSAVNSTEFTSPIPSEEIEAAINNAESSLASATSAKLKGKLKSSFGSINLDNDTEISVVTDKFKETVSKPIISYMMINGKLIALSFDAKGSKIDFGMLFSPIIYDRITLRFDENGNNIAIIYTEDYRYEIVY